MADHYQVVVIGAGPGGYVAALKADPLTADIPVFMISILGERAKALAAGADGIVMKPFDASKVKAALAGLKATRGQPRAKAANE